MVPLAHTCPHHKPAHMQFTCFCAAYGRDRHTGRQTTLRRDGWSSSPHLVLLAVLAMRVKFAL